jgi:hypothetical protein
MPARPRFGEANEGTAGQALDQIARSLDKRASGFELQMPSSTHRQEASIGNRRLRFKAALGE